MTQQPPGPPVPDEPTPGGEQPDPWAQPAPGQQPPAPQPDPQSAGQPRPPYDPPQQPSGQPSAQQPYAPHPGGQPYGQHPYDQQPGGQPYGYGPAPVTPSEERTWAIFAHLGGVFLSFLVPLIIWLVYRERSRYLDDQGKEALNFQITLVIAYLVGGITTIIGIGFLILLATWVCSIVFAILAAVACSRQEWYRYPLTIRFIR